MFCYGDSFTLLFNNNNNNNNIHKNGVSASTGFGQHWRSFINGTTKILGFLKAWNSLTGLVTKEEGARCSQQGRITEERFTLPSHRCPCLHWARGKSNIYESMQVDGICFSGSPPQQRSELRKRQMHVVQFISPYVTLMHSAHTETSFPFVTDTRSISMRGCRTPLDISIQFYLCDSKPEDKWGNSTSN
jgi:hypothetical protein